MKNWAAGLVGLCTLSLMTFSLSAQTGNEPSRQERIREHNERIRKIIEESQKRRAEQQAAQQGQQPPAAPGQPAGTTPTPAAGAPGAPGAVATPPAAAQPGQPLPTGPVQNARMTPPIQKPGQTPLPQGQAPQSARSESRTILMFHPIDSIVDVGERFKTDLVAETKEGEIDEISILLKYPRHILNPLALDHGQLDPYVKDKIDYEFNPEQGTIYLHAKLKSPQRFGQKPLVSLVWEALEPTDGAVISYEFGEPKTTGLFLNGSNLLGTLPGAEDGVIRTMVQVKDPKSKMTVTKLQDKGVLIGNMPETSADDVVENLELKLVPSATTVKAGEVFDVGVFLENPESELVDKIRLYLQFDPATLQVVDSDAGNVVTRGTNILDAFARAEFPFDYYRYNYADNKAGDIVYEVSASNSKVRGDGKFAVIRLKALREVPRTELVLVQNAEGLVPTSDVTYLAQSRLQSDAGSEAKPLEGLAIRVQGQLPVEEASIEGSINPFESELAQRMRRNGN